MHHTGLSIFAVDRLGCSLPYSGRVLAVLALPYQPLHMVEERLSSLGWVL
jgi:hypothetical protein